LVHPLSVGRGEGAREQCNCSTQLALATKTLSLLERGLLQIKDTVAALLVEARVERHALSRQDVEDTRTLVLASINRKSGRLSWENGIHDTVALPATQVRQILMNLLLNAAHAIESHGHVSCCISPADDRLHIVVRNDGRCISPERLEHLFEPFAHAAEQGHGLGLWVTYQIVRQLEGEITATSRAGETRFDVVLPFGREGAAMIDTPRRRSVG
jgi:signal transduction histidine kinase